MKTKSNGIAKPKKPYPDFPLFAHATRRWAKKIRGNFCYFGPWDDPDGALERYLDQRDDLYAGRVPRAKDGVLELRDLANRFLSAKERKLATGELKPKSFKDYHATCGRLLDAFGLRRPVDDLRSDDFARLRAEIANTRGPVSLGNEVQRTRTVFKYAYDEGLIDTPMRFGTEFVKPSARILRQARLLNGPKLFDPAQIHAMIKVATVPMRAMVLMGVNCGFGNTDCSELPVSALDLDAGSLDFPRPKTFIARRALLWPQTVEAIRSAIEQRPAPKAKFDAGQVFITRWGRRWVQGNTDSVGLEFAKLLRKASIEVHGRFYNLRHTFRTVADAVKDQPATDLVMGHYDASMAGRYREEIEDHRLLAVSDHVHKWLFGDWN